MGICAGVGERTMLEERAGVREWVSMRWSESECVRAQESVPGREGAWAWESVRGRGSMLACY